MKRGIRLRSPVKARHYLTVSTPTDPRGAWVAVIRVVWQILSCDPKNKAILLKALHQKRERESIMSVVEIIRGLRKMGVADGAAATPPPSPRNPQPISVAAVVAALGGLDGLRVILTEHWRPERISAEYVEEGLEVHNMPEEMIELLTNGIEEALCRGFLEEHHALFMAVRRVELLISENITLPLARDKDRVWQLIREKEEDDWKLMIETMTQSFPALLVSK